MKHRDPLLVINAFTKPFQARGGAGRVEGNTASVRGKVGRESWWQRSRRLAREGIATQGTKAFSFCCICSLVGAALLYKGASRACFTGYSWNVKSGSYLGAFLFAMRNRKDAYSVKPFSLKSFLVIWRCLILSFPIPTVAFDGHSWASAVTITAGTEMTPSKRCKMSLLQISKISSGVCGFV